MKNEDAPLFAHHIKGWLLQDNAEPPNVESRRTSQCLRFPEISAVARDKKHPVALAKKDHISSCAWCTRALAAARQVQEEDALSIRRRRAASENSGIWNSSFGDLAWAATHAEASSLPATEWSQALKTHLAAALRQLAVAETDAPAVFDSAGTLRIEMTNCDVDGPVAVFLMADDLPIPVGRETVRGGKLSLVSHSISDFNLRDIRLPSTAITLRPLSRAA